MMFGVNVGIHIPAQWFVHGSHTGMEYMEYMEWNGAYSDLRLLNGLYGLLVKSHEMLLFFPADMLMIVISNPDRGYHPPNNIENHFLRHETGDFHCETVNIYLIFIY